MNSEKEAEHRREYFLAQLRKAEDLAARAMNAQSREQWLKIADGYRHLAQLREKG